MKKLILFFAILILSQCQINFSVKDVQAQEPIGKSGGLLTPPKSWTIYEDGMTYRVFIYGNAAQSAAICVTNVTKDKLEVEKLQLEIRNLKKLGN